MLQKIGQNQNFFSFYLEEFWTYVVQADLRGLENYSFIQRDA